MTWMRPSTFGDIILMCDTWCRMASASACTSERVPRATIPGFQVDLLVEEPRGAYPTGCLGLYPADAAHLESYLALAEQGREAEYLENLIGDREAA